MSVQLISLYVPFSKAAQNAHAFCTSPSIIYYLENESSKRHLHLDSITVRTLDLDRTESGEWQKQSKERRQDSRK